MPVTLDELVTAARRRAEQAQAACDAKQLSARAAGHSPRGLRRSLERAGALGPAVIAELKRASPSRGVLRGSFPVARLAVELEQGGAAALSVLTEEEHFQGSLANLCEASAATHLPCLRKDFIVDEFQVLEAKANGADAVLLIAAALPAAELEALARQARELGLDVLCEVHDEGDLERAAAAGCGLIGVNSRDLRTFQVDLGTLLRLAPRLPADVVRVAESGIRSAEEMRRLRDVGYQAFLIGESLMKAESPGQALRRLIAEAKAPPLGSIGITSWRAGTKD
ncbi:MAG TPA: indole-3-glycerol phosphate synthase TrpC [Terriglobales bacterium]|jgi:indole-3-glycerol phosphate synthase|nr:indole-3-glycerol phosphate synthase TrpC [Terriglobales bacterium]